MEAQLHTTRGGGELVQGAPLPVGQRAAKTDLVFKVPADDVVVRLAPEEATPLVGEPLLARAQVDEVLAHEGGLVRPHPDHHADGACAHDPVSQI